nr:ubiquinone biosynthesis protein UbiB [Desulfuromonadales bacterium]
MRDRMTPASFSKEALRLLHAYGALAKNLPRDLKEFVNRVNRNQFKIDLEHRGLERLINDLDKSSNRVSFSL